MAWRVGTTLFVCQPENGEAVHVPDEEACREDPEYALHFARFLERQRRSIERCHARALERAGRSA